MSGVPDELSSRPRFTVASPRAWRDEEAKRAREVSASAGQVPSSVKAEAARVARLCAAESSRQLRELENLRVRAERKLTWRHSRDLEGPRHVGPKSMTSIRLPAPREADTLRARAEAYRCPESSLSEGELAEECPPPVAAKSPDVVCEEKPSSVEFERRLAAARRASEKISAQNEAIAAKDAEISKQTSELKALRSWKQGAQAKMRHLDTKLKVFYL